MFLAWARSIHLDTEQLPWEMLALPNRFTPEVLVPGTLMLNVQEKKRNIMEWYLRTLKTWWMKTCTSP